ncbi:MAG: DNA topoisomerase IB [Chloroflexota bacterium]|nr:DNA topoisomerase IB [Chloroflexota bacterium]
MTFELDDARVSAEEAGLRYVTDTMPGVRRRRAGRTFTYIGPGGDRITDADRIAWFQRLAIPPAWTDVWISPIKRGHLQATGRDARGRKVYRYHPRWREVRDQAKYGRLIEFARALPKIRRRTDRDLRRRGLPREKVLALVVRLLEETLIRVGNEEYARDNGSFGLSTLRDRHVKGNGSDVRFSFKGKSGREHEVPVRDRRLARLVRQVQDLPGQVLFQYVDADGGRQGVSSDDVNEYLREISGEDFTAKDFRTWAGTVAASMALQDFLEIDDEAGRKKAIVSAIEEVAGQLGNTPAVCRACYVHPDVIESYLDGTLIDALSARVRGAGRGAHALRPEEAAVLGLLQARLAREQRKNRRAAA